MDQTGRSSQLLRIKLYQNAVFFANDQNVNKSNNRAPRTVNGIIILPFFVCQLFTSFCQDVNETISNCAIIGFNLSMEHKLTMYKTQNGKPSYIVYNFFFNFC